DLSGCFAGERDRRDLSDVENGLGQLAIDVAVPQLVGQFFDQEGRLAAAGSGLDHEVRGRVQRDSALFVREVSPCDAHASVCPAERSGPISLVRDRREYGYCGDPFGSEKRPFSGRPQDPVASPYRIRAEPEESRRVKRTAPPICPTMPGDRRREVRGMRLLRRVSRLRLRFRSDSEFAGNTARNYCLAALDSGMLALSGRLWS